MSKKAGQAFGTLIKFCTCAHPYQDAKYGKQKRVFNQRKDGGWRCTVCGRTDG